MPNVLIQFAHPMFSKSRVQKTLLKYCRNIEGVTFNDLYEQYPDLYIDVAREKQLLIKNDVIILQHPFFWYSGPAIIKQWLDLVLEYNWAYGPEGQALAGKKLMSAISSGGRKDAYEASGLHNFPVKEFLLPFQQTATLCGMKYLPPFVIHNADRLEQPDLEVYGRQYAATLTALVKGDILHEIDKVSYINDLNLAAPVNV